MKNAFAASNQRLLDKMMADGVLAPDAHASATSFVALHGGRVEDALIENGLLSETDVLRYVATQSGTRFVGTEKLYKASIDQRILALIPRKLADQHQVFPVIYDEGARSLSVVTPDPDNLAALTEVKIAAGVREVAALVGRPAAVSAAIQRAYHNDASLFAALMRPATIQLSVDRFHTAGSITGPNPLAAGITGPNPIPLTVTHDRAEVHAPRGAQAAPAPAPAPPAAAPQPGPPRPPPGGGERAVRTPPIAPSLTPDYVETLNVLVSLLENSRPDLRGHSALTARLIRKVGDRMGLSPSQVAAFVVAAYLHDLGKAGSYHLTALNVAEYEGHRTAAQKVFNVPERFLQGVQLTPDTKTAINGMYERFDGRGFPLGLAGKDIPLGARLLAVADTYADLTQNPRNPARKMLNAGEAMQFLSKHRGTVFDPTVLDLFRAEVAGDDLRAKILADRHNVLLVDTDPEDTTVLELKLLEAGFDVRIARTMQQALHELRTKEITIVISEVDLETPDAGLTLRSTAAGEAAGQNVVVWIIHTRKSDRQLAEIVFELGVDDLVSKPSPPDVFVAKVRQLVERKRARSQATAAPRGVSGSLAEMALPDVVQILWHGRKTCTVKLKTAKGAGDIGFVDGQIVDARLPPHRGEEAFYRMLALKEGDFQIDPQAAPTQKTIEVSPEGLLLEGMRRLDEGLI